jgi:hypothetical protein
MSQPASGQTRHVVTSADLFSRPENAEAQSRRTGERRVLDRSSNSRLSRAHETSAPSPHERRGRDCCLSWPAAQSRSDGAARLGGRRGRPFVKPGSGSRLAATGRSARAQVQAEIVPFLRSGPQLGRELVVR